MAYLVDGCVPRGRLMKRRAGLLQGLSIAEHCHRLCSRAATPEVRRSRLAHRLALKDTNPLAVVDFVEVEALLEVVAVALNGFSPRMALLAAVALAVMEDPRVAGLWICALALAVQLARLKSSAFLAAAKAVAVVALALLSSAAEALALLAALAALEALLLALSPQQLEIASPFPPPMLSPQQLEIASHFLPPMMSPRLLEIARYFLPPMMSPQQLEIAS